MTPCVVSRQYSLAPAPSDALLERQHDAIIVGSTSVVEHRRIVEYRIGCGCRERAKPKGVGRSVINQFVVSMIAHVVDTRHRVTAEAVLNFQIPFLILRHFRLPIESIEIRSRKEGLERGRYAGFYLRQSLATGKSVDKSLVGSGRIKKQIRRLSRRQIVIGWHKRVDFGDVRREVIDEPRWVAAIENANSAAQYEIGQA